MRKLILLLIPLFIFMTCNDNNGDDRDYNITIQLEEYFCTFVTMKITASDSGEVREFLIKRNDIEIMSDTLIGIDTVITDYTAKPSTDYNYQAYYIKENVIMDSSNILQVRTEDTTSSNFVWEIDTLGNYNSLLNDVAIIAEDDIWVVGEIRTDSINYNAAHWDGEKWELIKILTGNSAVYSIKYFSENDIWVSDVCSPIHWDGNEWTHYHLQNMGLDVCSGNSIWGTSSDNMYFAGRNGDIVHYDGSDFTKLEVDLEIEGHFIDIDGTADGKKVFVVIYQYWHAPHKQVVFQIEDETVTTLFYSDDNTSDYGEYEGPIAVKVIDDYAYIKVYEHIWRHNWKTGSNKFTNIVDDCPAHIGISKLDGNDHNDLFGLAETGWFTHYNGSSWHCEYWMDTDGDHYNDFAVLNNIVAIVGQTNDNKAIVIRGKRFD